MMLWQPFDIAAVPGQYLGHECPSYRNIDAMRHRVTYIITA